MEKGKMTTKQERVFEAIKKYISENGYSPSVRDICEMLSLSTGTVHGHLVHLREKGHINFVDGVCRSITIQEKSVLNEF